MKAPLRGWDAQKIMSSRGYDMNRTPNSNSKKAAVMILLFQDSAGHWQTVYIKRPSKNPHDKHSGQISFPGGQREDADTDLVMTALRETEEELGIPRADIEVITSLSSIYVFVSDFNVLPVVGFLAAPPTFVIQESEVAYPIVYPLADLMQVDPAPRKDVTVQTGVILKDIPYYDLNGDTLWGATAMMTSELLEMLRWAFQS